MPVTVAKGIGMYQGNVLFFFLLINSSLKKEKEKENSL